MIDVFIDGSQEMFTNKSYAVERLSIVVRGMYRSSAKAEELNVFKRSLMLLNSYEYINKNFDKTQLEASNNKNFDSQIYNRCLGF